MLGPWIRDHVEPMLAASLGWTPFFRGPKVAVGMMTASVVLAIMIIPYISAVCTSVFRLVPDTQREAALALGATKWEMVKTAVLPYGFSGIVGAVILGLGRALGETIAIAMVIGNSPQISVSLFGAGATLASVIANEFAEAVSDLHVAALIELALVLLILGVLLNIVARSMVAAVASRRFDGAKR
jgi:phosphate transport system permease protein